MAKVIIRSEVNALIEGVYTDNLTKAVLYGELSGDTRFTINPVNSVSNTPYTATQALLEADIRVSAVINVTLTPRTTTVLSTETTVIFDITTGGTETVGTPVWSIVTATYDGGTPTSAVINGTQLIISFPANSSYVAKEIQGQVKVTIDGNDYQSNLSTITQNPAGRLMFNNATSTAHSTASTMTQAFTNNNCTNVAVASSSTGTNATINRNNVVITFPQNTASTSATREVCLSGKTPDNEVVYTRHTITQSAAVPTSINASYDGNDVSASGGTIPSSLFTITLVNMTLTGASIDGGTLITGGTATSPTLTVTVPANQTDSSKSYTITLSAKDVYGRTETRTIVIPQDSDTYSFTVTPNPQSAAPSDTTATVSVVSSGLRPESIGVSGSSSDVTSTTYNNGTLTVGFPVNEGVDIREMTVTLTATTIGGRNVSVASTIDQTGGGAASVRIVYDAGNMPSTSGATNAFQIFSNNANVIGYSADNGARVSDTGATGLTLDIPANTAYTEQVYTVTVSASSIYDGSIVTGLTTVRQNAAGQLQFMPSSATTLHSTATTQNASYITNCTNVGLLAQTNMTSSSITTSTKTVTMGFPMNSGPTPVTRTITISGKTPDNTTITATYTITHQAAVNTDAAIRYTGEDVTSASGSTSAFTITLTNATLSSVTVPAGCTYSTGGTPTNPTITVNYPANQSDSPVDYTVTVNATDIYSNPKSASATIPQASDAFSLALSPASQSVGSGTTSSTIGISSDNVTGIAVSGYTGAITGASINGDNLVVNYSTNTGSDSRDMSVTITGKTAAGRTATATATIQQEGSGTTTYGNYRIEPSSFTLTSGDVQSGVAFNAYIDEYVNGVYVRTISVNQTSSFVVSDNSVISIEPAGSSNQKIYPVYGSGYYPSTRHATLSGNYTDPKGNTYTAQVPVDVAAEGRIEQYIEVSPASATIESDGQVQLGVTAYTKTDGVITSSIDVTTAATYSENSPYFNVSTGGKVTGTDQSAGGSGTITVQYPGIDSIQVPITVKPKNGTITVECTASEWHVGPESGDVEFTITWTNLSPGSTITFSGGNELYGFDPDEINITQSNYASGTAYVTAVYDENQTDQPVQLTLYADAKDINDRDIEGSDWYEQAAAEVYTYGLVLNPQSVTTQSESGDYSFTANFVTYNGSGDVVDSEDVTNKSNCYWSVSPSSSSDFITSIDDGTVEWENRTDSTQSITVSASYGGYSNSVSFNVGHGTISYVLELSTNSSNFTYDDSADITATLSKYVEVDGQDYFISSEDVTDDTTWGISSVDDEDFINLEMDDNTAVWRYLGSSSTNIVVSGSYNGYSDTLTLTIPGVSITASITIVPVETVSCLEYDDTLQYYIDVHIMHNGVQVFTDSWHQPDSNSDTDFYSSDSTVCDTIESDTVQNVNQTGSDDTVTLTATFSENDAYYLLPGTTLSTSTTLCCETEAVGAPSITLKVNDKETDWTGGTCGTADITWTDLTPGTSICFNGVGLSNYPSCYTVNAKNGSASLTGTKVNRLEPGNCVGETVSLTAYWSEDSSVDDTDSWSQDGSPTVELSAESDRISYTETEAVFILTWCNLPNGSTVSFSVEPESTGYISGIQPSSYTFNGSGGGFYVTASLTEMEQGLQSRPISIRATVNAAGVSDTDVAACEQVR